MLNFEPLLIKIIDILKLVLKLSFMLSGQGRNLPEADFYVLSLLWGSVQEKSLYTI